jgi:hypothetical protein
MGPLRRISFFLWLLLKELPPVSTGRLIMPVTFLLSWMVFLLCGAPERAAFVWAAVLAQAAHLWAVLPVSVTKQRRAFGEARNATLWAVGITFGVLVVQVWVHEPWLTQRIVSLYLALYVGMMIMGLRGDRIALDRTVPVLRTSNVPLVFRRHLLRLYALTAIVAIAINEALIVADTALSVRVATLALLPVGLHYFFQIVLRLTCPLLEDEG